MPNQRDPRREMTIWDWIWMTAVLLLILWVIAVAGQAMAPGADAPAGAEIHCEQNQSFLGGQDVVCEPYWP